MNKNRTYYFLGDTISVKNLDPNNIKLYRKSLKYIVIYCIGYATPNTVKPFLITPISYPYLIINKVNEYIDEHNENKYLTLVHTYKGEDALTSIEN